MMLLDWLSNGCNSSLALELVIVTIGLVLCLQIMILSEQITRLEEALEER